MNTNSNASREALTPETALQKILDALDIHDLNINSRGLFEGYIKQASRAALMQELESGQVETSIANFIRKACEEVVMLSPENKGSSTSFNAALANAKDALRVIRKLLKGE